MTGLRIYSLAELVHGRANNFTLLRFVAASLVLYAHCYPLALGKGAGHHDPLSLWLIPRLGTGLAGLAVDAFFVASGFLITASYANRAHLASFIEARVLRIYPALWVALFFTAVVVAGSATTLPAGEYFSHPKFWGYVVGTGTLLNLQFHLPGVFADLPWPQGVNGSLWTLPIELTLYALVGAAGWLGLLHQRAAANLLFVIGLLLYLRAPQLTETAQQLKVADLMLCFGLGGFLFVNREQIPMGFVPMSALLALAWALRATPYGKLAALVALAYGLLLFAYHPLLRLPSLDRWGDFSYGLYIYAFPVQQGLVWLHGGQVTPLGLFFQAFPITFGLAVASWFLVERPALRLKGRFPWWRWFDWQHQRPPVAAAEKAPSAGEEGPQPGPGESGVRPG
jgi:peptidoglycan/LPS O-acetylase OafA/YrhL